MRKLTATAMVGILGICLWAAEPVKLPPEVFKARADYKDAQAKAKTAFTEATKKAAEDHKKMLKELLDAETKAGRLDAALAIRDEIMAVDAGGTETAAKVPGGREGAIPFAGSQYRIILAPGTWVEARDICRKLGGDLAVVDTVEKREFLGRLNGTLELWVGASRDAKGNKWAWVNGTTVKADSYYYCRRCGIGSVPWDELVGLSERNLTPALEQLTALTGGVADSFEKGSDLLALLREDSRSHSPGG